MRVKDNLSSIISSIGKNSFSPAKKAQVGRVYGVVTTENTPTKEMFEKVGGYSGIGTIFYLDYEQSKKTIEFQGKTNTLSKNVFVLRARA